MKTAHGEREGAVTRARTTHDDHRGGASVVPRSTITAMVLAPKAQKSARARIVLRAPPALQPAFYLCVHCVAATCASLPTKLFWESFWAHTAAVVFCFFLLGIWYLQRGRLLLYRVCEKVRPGSGGKEGSEEGQGGWSGGRQGGLMRIGSWEGASEELDKLALVFAVPAFGRLVYVFMYLCTVT